MSKLNISFIFLIVFCLFVFIGFAGWLFVTSNPIIYSYRNPASASMGPNFVILNPFRIKQPEVVAEQMLVQIRNGECKIAIADLDLTTSAYSTICENEAIYKLEDWTLADRRDTNGTSELYYRTMRKGFSDYTGYIIIKVMKKDDIWTSVTADFIY